MPDKLRSAGVLREPQQTRTSRLAETAYLGADEDDASSMPIAPGVASVEKRMRVACYINSINEFRGLKLAAYRSFQQNGEIRTRGDIRHQVCRGTRTSLPFSVNESDRLRHPSRSTRGVDITVRSVTLLSLYGDSRRITYGLCGIPTVVHALINAFVSSPQYE